MSEQDFIEKYPEFKSLIQSCDWANLDGVKEILDKHFVRIKDVYKLEIENRTWIEKQKVKDAIDKHFKTYDGIPYCVNLRKELKKELRLEE